MPTFRRHVSRSVNCVPLINQDGKRMVSLGILSSDQATFPVPPDAVSQGYTIVDLSNEQFDDRPQHSGDSIMRGTLPV